MAIYLIQVSIGITAWWLLYRLFFKAKAAARTNRFFLVGGLILPFLLPLIPLSGSVIASAEPILLPAIIISDDASLSGESLQQINWFFVLYAFGLVATLLYQFSGLLTFFKLKKGAYKESNSTSVYRFSGSFMPFSFFGTIFLPEKLPAEQEALIVAHEKWHIKLFHSWDVALGSLVQAALWFFPLIPLYIRDLRTEHEFEVDEHMLNSTSFSTYAETLLHVSLMPVQHKQFNAFSTPTLKKRIKMMTIRQKQNTWKLILFLPLMASMIYLNACNKQAEETTEPIENVAQGESTLQMAEVDAPPQFLDCATTESAEAQMNCFNNGIMKQIMENLKYPESAREARVEGRMFIAFVVDKKGDVSNIEIKRGIPITSENEVAVKEMEDAATGVFKSMPKLIPAQKEGKAVAMEFVVPINFALPPTEEPKN